MCFYVTKHMSHFPQAMIGLLTCVAKLYFARLNVLELVHKLVPYCAG